MGKSFGHSAAQRLISLNRPTEAQVQSVLSASGIQAGPQVFQDLKKARRADLVCLTFQVLQESKVGVSAKYPYYEILSNPLCNPYFSLSR